MAWSTPISWAFGQTVTSSQLNSNIRDNMNETAVAKATRANSYFVGTAANTLAERVYAQGFDNTTDTTTSTTFTDLTGGASPTTGSITTGTRALVLLTGLAVNNTVGSGARMAFEVSGATTTAADDSACIGGTSATASANLIIGGTFIATLVAGSNTFVPKYRAVTSGTASFLSRRIIVLSF